MIMKSFAKVYHFEKIPSVREIELLRRTTKFFQYSDKDSTKIMRSIKIFINFKGELKLRERQHNTINILINL